MKFLKNIRKKIMKRSDIELGSGSENNLNDECPICLDEIFTDSISLNCKHRIHKNCLIDLYKVTDEPICPYCRVPIKEKILKKTIPFKVKFIKNLKEVSRLFFNRPMNIFLVLMGVIIIISIPMSFTAFVIIGSLLLVHQIISSRLDE